MAQLPFTRVGHVRPGHPRHADLPQRPRRKGGRAPGAGGRIGFYRRPPFPFLQVVWPNRDGTFPWRSDGDDRCRGHQPHLWLRPDEHPPGVWTQDL
ncbi:DUF4262 domain-containing protein [Nonomuraea wenchangensis]